MECSANARQRPGARSAFNWNVLLYSCRLLANSMLSAVPHQTASAGSSKEGRHKPLYKKRAPEKWKPNTLLVNSLCCATTVRFGWDVHSSVCYSLKLEKWLVVTLSSIILRLIYVYRLPWKRFYYQSILAVAGSKVQESFFLSFIENSF